MKMDGEKLITIILVIFHALLAVKHVKFLYLEG